MENSKNIIDEPTSSIVRRLKIRKILDGESKIEYFPRLLFGKSDWKHLTSAVFIFPERDNTFSLQTDNFENKLLFPSWDKVLDILMTAPDSMELINNFKLQDNMRGVFQGLISCTLENMPISGLLFSGKNIDNPTSAYFFSHPEIPEQFSFKALLETIEDQRKLVRKMM